MFLGIEHGGFIFASYAVAAVIIAVLIIWVWGNLKTQKKRLAELEASGASSRRRKRSKKVSKNGQR